MNTKYNNIFSKNKIMMGTNFSLFFSFVSRLTSIIVFLSFAFCLFTSPPISAQGWTWMNGSNQPEQSGYYGKIYPRSREGGTSWKGQDGTMWFLGGQTGASSNYHSNDFWKYDPIKNEWILLNEFEILKRHGEYGTKGTPSIDNLPCGRRDAVSWVDLDGNLWLFGGNDGASTLLNDLWKYNPSTNEWTWVSGSHREEINPVGDYGTRNVPSPENVPGARYTSIGWADDGNLYLFGGRSTGTYQYFNDFWKYNIASNEWTWIGGSDDENSIGQFGSKGFPHVDYIPAAKGNAVSWSDLDGNFWLFGGRNIWGPYNDLWKYDIISKKWTWISGNARGEWEPNSKYGLEYGEKGIPSEFNNPGTRAESVSWVDNFGIFWLFGGQDRKGRRNDLWRYNTATNEWTWISGSDTIYSAPLYGELEVPSLENVPSSRWESHSWTDKNGFLYLFGGSVFYIIDSLAYGGPSNDLWKYNIESNEWTWINGSANPSHPGFTSHHALRSDQLTPGARFGSASWTYDLKNFHLFGGEGHDKDGNFGYLNDYWNYNGTNWTFLDGSIEVNESGVYGTLGEQNRIILPGEGKVLYLLMIIINQFYLVDSDMMKTEILVY